MKEDLPFFSDRIPFLLQNDEIKWIIGFIREILEEISTQVSCPLKREEKQLFSLYQKERKQLLDFLSAVESYIEQISLKTMQENIEFRNYISFNKEQINKQESDQTEGKEVTRKTNISVDSMSNYHKLTRIFCALVSCSAYAMFLKYTICAIGEKTNETALAYSEQNKTLLAGQKMIMDVCSEIKKQLDQNIKEQENLDYIKKGQELTLKKMEQTNKIQEEIKANQKELKKLMNNRNEIDKEKTGTLSIEQCVTLIGIIKRKYVELMRADFDSVGIPPETVKDINEKTIRRYVEFWDQTLKGNIKQGRKLPRKDYSRNMSIEDYSKLFNDIEYDKYMKWRARNKIYEQSIVRGRNNKN